MGVNFGTVRGAYGRKYSRIAEIERDFLDGKDFRMALTGQYISIRDMGPGDSLTVRYFNDMKVTVVKRPKNMK